MNDLLISKLTTLSEDEVALTALETIFMERINLEKPTIETSDNNYLIGEKFRAYEKAKEMLKTTINEIRNFKKIRTINNGFNKAK